MRVQAPHHLEEEEEEGGNASDKEEEDWTGWMGSSVPIAAASVAVWSVLFVATTVGTLAALTLVSVGGATYAVLVRAPRAAAVLLFAEKGQDKEEDEDNSPSHEDLQKVEDSLLLQYGGVRCARHVVLRAQDSGGGGGGSEEVHAIHAIIHPNHAGDKAKMRVGVVLVHGTYSSCVTFSYCMPHLIESEYDVWAVDLPGFGRSTHPAFPGALSAKDATERIVQAHVDAVRRVVDATGHDQVMVIGHSLGAYVAMEYAMRHPRRVTHLVLACPPGIFPTLGSIGACWGAMLRHSIYVQRAVQLAGTVGVAAVDGTLRLVGTSRPTRESILYWYRLNCTRQASWGVEALYRFMDFGWTHAMWRRPLLPRMHALGGIRVLTVYGGSDTLVPSHQGVVLARLLAIPCTIMQGAGHLLFSDERGAREFCSAVVQWHRSPVTLSPNVCSSSSSLNKVQRIVEGVDLASFPSTFVPACTRRIIARLYMRLGVEEGTVERILA